MVVAFAVEEKVVEATAGGQEEEVKGLEVVAG